MPEVRLVYVADREGDILGLIKRAAALRHPADWLVRSQHNRKLNKDSERLWKQVAVAEACGEILFDLPSRHGQKARPVRQSVRVQRAKLPVDGKILKVSAVMATELDPPLGVMSTAIEI